MIPEKIIVTVEGECKAGLAVLLRFKMVQKNDYSFIIFLNSEGRVEVTKDELLKEFDRTANFFQMDYANARGGFTGTIETQVLNKEEIEAAIHAYERFEKHLDYPPEYLSNLRKALATNPPSRCAVRVEQV